MPEQSYSVGSRLYAWLQLVRLPNVFTAMADVAMGLFFVQGVAAADDAAVLGLLLGASSLLYIAGVVLGDVFDIEQDRGERPERPLPSGRIALGTAAGFGWGALLLGVGLAWGAAWHVANPWPGIVACGLAACIVLYDAGVKKTPAGPVAMGACRMLNVLMGMSVVSLPWAGEHWLVAGAVGIYITGLTWFARSEATESRPLQLGLATVVMMAGVAALAWLPGVSDRVVPLLVQQPDRWRLFLTVLGLLIGWRCVRAMFDPMPGLVQVAVGQGILSLVVLDAAACYAVCGMGPAAVILLLLVPAMFAGRWIRMT